MAAPPPPTTPSFLSPTQRYAAAALFGLALHEAHLNQTSPFPLPVSEDSLSVSEQRTSNSSSSGSDSVSDDPDLWVHSNSGLLRPVFKFLDIDSAAWSGLEETAGSSSATHHVGPEAIETMVACSAMAFLKGQESKNEETQSKDSKWVKLKRGGIIGAAALTGGALLAITGGLAAPAIAAGLGALAPTLGTLIPVIGASGFAAAAGAAGTVAGSVAVAASFGAAGAGLTGSKMARRVGGVDEFEFKAIGENHNQGRLGVEILVSGFVFEKEDFIRPWEGQNDNLERYALQWESENLIAVSTAIQDWLTSKLAMELMKRGAMMTVLSSLLTALAWPAALLAATDFIDSKWTIAINRSNKAGKLLAEVLLKGLQGNRPVTLIGYSLGARVIFKCLQYLAKTENGAELVEKVVLLGAPIPIMDENWEATRKMVAGRFVNAYSRTDWMLGVAFRASLLTKGLAGIQPVDIPGIQNVDVTEHIEGHSSYLWATQKILDQLQLDTYYPVYNYISCIQIQ
ncbi:Transmembrane and coiled-coil domain-containing protein 4 [Glycine soja]